MLKKNSLYILTQQADPHASLLGFFWEWIKRFSEHFDTVYVACYDRSESVPPPDNVRLLKFSYYLIPKTWLEIVYARMFRNLKCVFVHMIPGFALAVYPVCKLLNVPIYLWYSHDHVDLKLKLAAKLSKKIFTAYEGGCRVCQEKVVVIGHGIPVAVSVNTPKLNMILCVARISPVKHIEDAVSAMPRILEFNGDLLLSVVGDIADKKYYGDLLDLCKTLDVEVNFVGKVPHEDVMRFYSMAKIMIDGNETGISKSALEAMSVGTPVIVKSKSFEALFGDDFEHCYYSTPEELSQKVVNLLSNQALYERLSEQSKNVVSTKYGLSSAVNKVLEAMKNAQ